MDCWQAVKKLQGTSIQTLARGETIDVLRVGSDGVTVRSQASDHDRSIPREYIQLFFDDLVRRGELSRSEINARYKARRSSAIAAILAKLPGVEYRLSPTRLYYRKT